MKFDIVKFFTSAILWSNNLFSLINIMYFFGVCLISWICRWSCDGWYLIELCYESEGGFLVCVASLGWWVLGRWCYDVFGDDWFVRWCQFVCVVCVAVLIELCVNKFCGLSDERLFRRYGMVICCRKCCRWLSCDLGDMGWWYVAESVVVDWVVLWEWGEMFWCVLWVWGGGC